VRLAEYTDYSLRVLMYCARHADRRVTVAELAERQGLPRNQVMKIVADFARHGLLQTARGRGGGVRLLRPADQIRVGDVVRLSETDFRMAECFDDAGGSCALAAGCRLRRLFAEALRAYLGTLDGVTLAEIAGVGAAPRGRGVATARPRRLAAAA
jgi:Rrf2 family nitric oxide-sensitive transcriptional repressor